MTHTTYDTYPIDLHELRCPHLAGIAAERLDTAHAYEFHMQGERPTEYIIFREWDHLPYWSLTVDDNGTPLTFSITCEEGQAPTEDDIDEALNDWLIDRMIRYYE
jgi:hypothetical protein